MNDEEQIFDYMAAAEETGRQLDSLVRQAPGTIKSTLATAFADEWRKVTVFDDLSEATGRLNDAIDKAGDLVKLLRQTIWAAIAVGAVIAIAIPVFAWAIMGK